MIVEPQPDRIDQRDLADGFRRCGRDLGSNHATEGMPHKCRRIEPERIHEFAVIDDELVPVAQFMCRFRRAFAGSRKFRRVHGEIFSKPRDKSAIGRETPRAVQINQRIATAGDLDIGVNAALPEFKAADFGVWS